MEWWFWSSFLRIAIILICNLSVCAYHKFLFGGCAYRNCSHSSPTSTSTLVCFRVQFPLHLFPKPTIFCRFLGRIYFCIRQILSTNQSLILCTYLGVKSSRKFVYMKGQHNIEFCIHMSSRCNHLYTHLNLNLGH